ncbi:glycosyltransferase family 2 protein [Gulosibacter molinativorax]|uniref:Glycosyltransferase family 2 protein n=1 Tax=Gulosibacter molinativorax TaxID=256821 RepID=A0ABT7C867_9MICO|nr:glycosyltransferase family 2 protein [Gulosibacter molinativorax]MDJ1371265.1 hypothetical protein [Gulosibacter molinativorax]QUY63675.1 Putative glycosyltransferase EpsH [Gulosibacter molinativorax]
MTDSPKASIVVPSRGGAERLPHLFEALRSQTESSWEAIVVIDGDIDNSALVVEEAAADLPVRSIVFPENRGRSAALNAGFASARGDILIRCDDDLRPSPDYVAAHVERHIGGEFGVVGLYRNTYPPTPYARAYGFDRDERFRKDAYAASEEQWWRFWAGNVSVTRTGWQRVGEYDRSFRAYGWEDVDWGYRAKQAGLDVVLAPELETPHHIAATTTAIRVIRAFHSGAARRKFEAKHGVGALPPADGGTGIWGALVRNTARLRNLTGLTRSARTIDRFADKLPQYIAEKAISLLVESASLSGYRRPDNVRNDV